jgi:hypothetical protein
MLDEKVASRLIFDSMDMVSPLFTGGLKMVIQLRQRLSNCILKGDMRKAP